MKMKFNLYLTTALLVLSLCVVADDQQFIEAVKNGDVDTVMSLLDYGIDVNQPVGFGTSALAHAAYRNDLAMVELLLLKGEADVNTANDFGATALYMAAANADAELVRRLLRAGSDPNAGLLSGETPLMAAANRGRLVVVKLLLENGADPDARESTGGQTALMWAAAEHQAKVIELLIEHKVDVNVPSNSGFTALMFAAQQGNADIARKLLNAGAQVDSIMFRSGLTPLMIASIGGFYDVVSVLLDRDANPDAIDKTGKSVLHHAVTYIPSSAAIREILAHGADPNVRLKLPREYSGDSINPEGATPLLQAAAFNNLDAVVALLDAGADPNIPTINNTTALMMASGAGVMPDLSVSDFEVAKGTQIVKLLLDLGVDVKAVGDYGWTALHSAAFHGRDETIRDLIAHGADTEVKDIFGQTPLSISLAIITEGLGDAYRQLPRSYREETGNLLLSLGATPLEQSGVKILSTRAGGNRQVIGLQSDVAR